jgi:hypothetical protein
MVIAMIGLAPGLAAADDQAPPPPSAQPAPAPAPYPPPAGAPPGAPPGYGPPGYGPPGYATQPPGVSSYSPEEITNFDDSAPVPSGYTKVTRARKGLIIGGGATLGAAYATTVFGGLVIAAFGDLFGQHTDAGPYFIPVFGPFLAMGQAKSSDDQFALAMLGIGQTAGAVMLIYGLANPRTVLVRNDQLIVTSVAPLIAPGAAGLSIVGRF